VAKTWPIGSTDDLPPAYLRTIEYTYTGRRLPAAAVPADRLLILIGDHQPAGSVTGRGALGLPVT